MTFKRVTSAVAGDTTHFGGVDVNKFSDYLGGTDIGASETVDIATLTAFRDSKFSLRNPANTFSYIFAPSAITTANRTVTLPLLTGNDQFTMDAFATTITNKTINATNNTITDSSTAAGDVMVSNGTKFVRKARGTSLQVLRTNSGGTDIEWGSLDSERVGKSTAASGSSVYTIAHGLGSNPTYAFVDCSSHTTARTFTTDSTNITVTFASTISSGTVTIYWRVVA
jgi:hypothetical protein